MGQRIGGGQLVEVVLDEYDQLIRESRHDVEEVSNYAQALNPINLFWRGAKFFLGRLYLTESYLALLPYSTQNTSRALRMQDAAYKFLEHVGMGIPKPKIQFEENVLAIPLEHVHWVNPYKRQFGIHPLLQVGTSGDTYRFKFVPGDPLQAWAEDICNLSAADLRRSA